MELSPKSPTSLRQTLQYLEWTLIIASLLMAMIVGSYHSLESIIYLSIFHLIFFILSLQIPLKRSLSQRRVYVFLNMSVFVCAILIGWKFDLMLYWSIAKSCFLLGRKDVALTVFFTGVVYFFAVAWRLPYSFQEKAAEIALKGISSCLNIQKAFFNELSFYLGASLFSILFSYRVIAERKSREKSEALTKQVEMLATALERSRIARDIHDSLGHSLTTLAIQLEFAQKLRERDPQQAFAAIDAAIFLANQCLQDVRRALHTLHKSDFDLNQALPALVEQVKSNQAFTVQLDVNLPPLPLQTSHQIYCIVQEGLTNIQKHAQSTQVKLNAWATSDCISIVITDNGQGFDTSLSHTGFGLRGMQERVQLLGGQIKIDSTLGQGTYIQVNIPY